MAYCVWNYDPIFRGLKPAWEKIADQVVSLFGTMTRFLGD